ncbi:hypothetical protein [Candidatus Formimonas warabiya]|uniref:Methylase-associated X1 domain-containing protein n=1 Tax=Formimonas warabiya TaxID=1761012 RepID=A0A3G1KWF9_FORW1|nr:hypothetical protein [Candidatus Formimonas warabiya]ATW26727.1 hypothetical protein DCMF_19925 [Candidatus Formimonas warabiya]
MSEAAPQRLSKQTLNHLFIEGLGVSVKQHSGVNPLLVDLMPPFPLRIRAYLYNCTNPPGGRAPDEYKFQIILPGQQRNTRGMLDYSDGRTPVLAAYARVTDEVKGGVFVLWDPYKHKEFAYSANMQVRTDTIIRALYEPVASSVRANGEIILAARPEHLTEALWMRVEIRLKEATS